jgi:hypothetical protein
VKTVIIKFRAMVILTIARLVYIPNMLIFILGIGPRSVRGDEAGGLGTVHGDIYIVHECLRCGFKKRNKLQPGDNQEILIEISRQEIYGEK